MSEVRPSPARLALRTILIEALVSISLRPGRTALTALGTLLGVGVLVLILGLTGAAAAQVSARFDEMTVREVTVVQREDAVQVGSMAVPPDAEDRVGRIDGVEAAGVTWGVLDVHARTGPIVDETAPEVGVRAVSPGIFEVAGATVRQGVVFSPAMVAATDNVAVVGAVAAMDLNLPAVTHRPQVLIGGHSFVVVGVLDDVERHAELLDSVLIPTGAARRLFAEPYGGDNVRVLTMTRTGAAGVVGRQIPVALRADAPERFEVRAVVETTALRSSVAEDLQGLFLLLAGVCLLVGMAGIANTTLVSVLERTPEIGLRRALGARPRQVAVQFLAEAGAVGTLGGLLGGSLATIAVVVVCVAQEWTAVLPWQIPILGPIVGTVTGVVAGLYPALRAARIEPLEALRSM